MIKILNLDTLVPSADTVKDDVMKSYEIEKKKIKALLPSLLIMGKASTSRSSIQATA